MYTISEKEKETVDILQNFSDYLHLSNFFSDVMRQAIWGIIKFLNYIFLNMQKSITDVLDFLDITKNQEVMNFLTTYRPVFYSIGMIVFVVTVYMLIFKPDADFFQPIKSALIGFGLILALPIIFSSFSTVAKSWAGVTISTSASQSVIQNNTYDVLALDQKVKWDTSKLNLPYNKNYLALPVPGYDENGNQTNKEEIKVAEKNTLNLVDTKEVVNTKDYTHYFSSDEISKKGVKVLTNSLTNGIGDDGETELKLKNITPWYKFDQYYYRYTWDTKAILFYLMSAIIVTGFLIFKLIKIEFELGFTYILFNSTSVTDMQGKRNWQMFISMVNSFATIIMVISLSKFYDIFYSIIDTSKVFQGNFILEVIAKIALMIAIIDGPNIFQQIFGVDAGLQSVWKTAVGAFAGSRMASGLIKKPFGGNQGKGGSSSVGNLLNSTGGVLNGAMDMAVGRQGNPIRKAGSALKTFGGEVSKGVKDFKDNGGALGQLKFDGQSNLAKENPDNLNDQSKYNETLDGLIDRNRSSSETSEPSPDLRRNENLQGQSTKGKSTPLSSTGNKSATRTNINQDQQQISPTQQSETGNNTTSIQQSGANRPNQILNSELFDSGITTSSNEPHLGSARNISSNNSRANPKSNTITGLSSNVSPSIGGNSSVSHQVANGSDLPRTKPKTATSKSEFSTAMQSIQSIDNQPSQPIDDNYSSLFDSLPDMGE